MSEKKSPKNGSASEVVEEWVGLSRIVRPLSGEELGQARQLVHYLYEVRGWSKVDDSRVVLSPSPLTTFVASGLATLAWANKKHCPPFVKRRLDGQVRNVLVDRCRTKSHLNAGQVYDQVLIRSAWPRLLVEVPVELSTEVLGYLFESENTVNETVSNLLARSVAVPVSELFEACTGGDMNICPARSMCEEVGSGELINLLGDMLDAVQFGNLSPSLPAFVDYLARRDGDLPDDILLESELARFSGPWVMHPKFCVLTDRPTVLHINHGGMLHSESGPACRWQDGTRIYALKNVRTKSSFVDRPDEETADSLKRLPVSQRKVCASRLPKAEQVVLAVGEAEDD